MNTIDETIKVFTNLAKEFDRKELIKAHEKVFSFVEGVEKYEIPILTDDENVKKYIKEFELQKPQNMISFFVEANFSAFESIHESIDVLSLSDLANSISKVDVAKRQIDMALANPKLKDNKLLTAQDNLLEASGELERKIEINIEQIRKIDNRGKWQFFLKSAVSVEKIDTYCYIARYALDALIKAFNLQILIAEYMGDIDINKSVLQPFDDFVDKTILSGDTCTLMHAYDKDKENGYWLNIRKKIMEIRNENINLATYVEDYEDDYDDIDFS